MMHTSTLYTIEDISQLTTAAPADAFKVLALTGELTLEISADITEPRAAYIPSGPRYGYPAEPGMVRSWDAHALGTVMPPAAFDLGTQDAIEAAVLENYLDGDHGWEDYEYERLKDRQIMQGE